MKNSLKAVLTIGIPASGKSTWARKHCNEHSNYIEINRDDIRANLFNAGNPVNWSTYRFTRKKEQAVSEEVTRLIHKAKDSNKNIILSDTNLNPVHRNRLQNELEGLGYYIQHKTFPISFEEACKRDAHRFNGVGYSVIARMYENYQKYLHSKPRNVVQEYMDTQAVLLTPEAQKSQECYLFDIDGTLAQMNTRGPFQWDKVGEDSPMIHVVRVLQALSHNAYQNYKIVILSGRDSVCRGETENWLIQNGIPYDALFMRAEGDTRKDTVVKEEILTQDVLPRFLPVAVFDDRPSVCRMWRDVGVPVFQLGNPYVEF